MSESLQKPGQSNLSSHSFNVGRPRPTRLPYIRELLSGQGRRNRDRETVKSQGQITPTESPMTETTTPSGLTNVVYGGIKYGELLKTSRSRSNDKIHGPPRRRRFRLTEEALEYFQQFSQIKIRRSFPLTSIESVELVKTNPAAFQVVFHNFVMELESGNPFEAKSWVDTLNECVAKWKDTEDISVDDMDETEDELYSEDTRGLENIGEYYTTAGVESPGTTPSIPSYSRPFSIETNIVKEEKEDDSNETKIPHQSSPRQRKVVIRKRPAQRERSRTTGMLRSSSSEDDPTGTYGQRRLNRKTIRRKLHLAPKLEKQAAVVKSTEDETKYFKKLHNDYAMIKYPRYHQWAIPSEKIIKLDKDNLQVMWRNSVSSKVRNTSSLRLDSVLEVRIGQQSDGFDRFPYEEMNSQSFSLVYENIKGKYVYLESLDLVCDHPKHFQEWMHGLDSLQIGPVTSMFPTRYENTDPILVWLKRYWNGTHENHELNEKDALQLAILFNPYVTSQQIKLFLADAHSHQHEATLSHGNALKWDGFVLLYNLMCGDSGRLYSVYQKYALKHKRLGLTFEEFREFLIKECYWKPEDCSRRTLKELMAFHDHHHRSFKKFISGNKPENWKVCSHLLSYAGFLSFLRSKHNATINPLHNTVYQDMTQPLSHYFINSSHNTYLEGDQIKGRSTLDAYVRALLQGSRCIEIDCWDNNVGREPIVYHGFTFTTKLALRDVVRTIKNYAFRMSHYPLIISIENHCNDQQQTRMAKIFVDELRDFLGQSMLATENLVEGKDSSRRRLPSPLELQGKILLKGSYREHSSKFLQKNISKASKAMFGKTLPKLPSIDAIPNETNGPVQLKSYKIERGSTRREARSFRRQVRQYDGNVETPEDDQELSYTKISEDLKRLIVYCQSTSIKPWSWMEQMLTSICQMFSFSEISIGNHCKKSSKEMLRCSERQFVRTYPKGARFDSSNYNPVPFWNNGIQMVALNYQFPDMYMHLNQGRFRQNGGCGYVLKPKIMRRANPGSGPYPFDVNMTEPHPLVPPCNLEIELLSGQNLGVIGKTSTNIHVYISLHGIPADCYEMNRAEITTGFWPQWPEWPEKLHCLTHQVLMPELCLVYFRVEIDVRALGSSHQLFGQNCIPLSSLQPGIKYIQLRKSFGELIPESGLFVRISMDYQTMLPDPEPIEEYVSHRKPTLQRQSDITSFDYVDKDTPIIDEDTPTNDEEFVIVPPQAEVSDTFRNKGEDTQIVTMIVEAEVNA